MAGKLYCHHEFLLITTIKLLEEIAARQEQGNAKLYELNTALADLNEKAHTLQRLHNKGFIEDADFREQSDALASQRKKLSDQRTQAIHGSKALEPWTSCGSCKICWHPCRRSPGNSTWTYSTSWWRKSSLSLKQSFYSN